MPGSTPGIERLVPVPQMSPAGFTRFSEINAARYQSQTLRDAFTAGRIPVGDLPEIVANIWTRDDSPTSGISEANWLAVFRQVGFFSWPPLLVRGLTGLLSHSGRHRLYALPGKHCGPNASYVVVV